MNRLAAAGNAAQRAYICRSCRLRLGFHEHLAFPRASTNRSFHRHVSLLEIQNTRQDAAVESQLSGPGEAAKKESEKSRDMNTNEVKSGTEISSLQSENLSKEAPDREAESSSQKPRRKKEEQSAVKSQEQSQAHEQQEVSAESSNSSEAVKAVKATRKRQGGKKLKAVPPAREKLSKDASQADAGAEKSDNAAPETSHDTKSSDVHKPTQRLWKIDYIMKDHKDVKSKMYLLAKPGRKKRGYKPLQNDPNSMLKHRRELVRRIVELDKMLSLSIAHHKRIGSKHHKSLKALSKSVTKMMRGLSKDDKMSASKVDAAGVDQSSQAEPAMSLKLAMQDMRRGKALQQLIEASSRYETSLLKTNSSEAAQDNVNHPAIKRIMDLLPKDKNVGGIPDQEKQTLHQSLEEVIPNFEKDDYIELLTMFRDYLSDPKKAEKDGVSLQQVPGATTLSQAMKAPDDRKGTSGNGEAEKPAEKKHTVLGEDSLSTIHESRLKSNELTIEPIHIEQAPVRNLAYGLDRVLFQPGVYPLQDARSKIYNFDPYLQSLMSVQDFNFDLLPGFTTSSKDSTLQKIARESNRKYTGSSSSMTGMLSQFHFLLSRFRPINSAILSRNFNVMDHHSKFTIITLSPSAVFLRWKKEEGLYAIDSDKEHDEMNVLSLLGNSLEKLLTLSTDEYEMFRKGSPETMPEEKINAPETYHYTGLGDVLMRSQLDAHDPRLPGTGMFDIKTRAVLPIRMDVAEYQANRDYEIRLFQGNFESYEREYIDMLRATMLKYMLQARIGRMDGIFVAYHNTVRLFGFQYMPLEEIDLAIHGQYDRSLGDEEFRLSVKLMNEVFNKATERYPQKSLRIHFTTIGGTTRTKMLIFAEPFSEEAVDQIQEKNEERNRLITKEILSGLGPKYDEDGKRLVSPPEEGNVEETSGQEATDIVLDETIEVTEDGEVLSPEKIIEPDVAAHSYKGDGESYDSSPLLAMQLTVNNFTNGESVTRPGFSTDSDNAKTIEEVSEAFSTSNKDEWTIEYKLREITNPKVAWGLYKETKAKRSSLIGRERDMGNLQFLRSFLKKYVESGRKHRARKNEEEGPDLPKILLGDERPRSK